MADSFGSAHNAPRTQQRPPRRKGFVVSSVLGILGEIFLTLAVVSALYIAWQLWWTGVVSEQTQTQQISDTSWTAPASSDGSYKIAKAQKGEPPAMAQPSEGDVVGQLYIPRFGLQWKRLIVEGTTPEQLARHGLGHYPASQLPGQLGNFAVAGHRSGYGEPLGNVPDFKEGDPIVVRTDDYWYVYEYTSHEIVVPTQVDVVAPVPHHQGETPTQRLITLTTCEPRYTTATHRWISYCKLKYWAKVSDGIPTELATQGDDGAVKFVQEDTRTWTSKIPDLTVLLLWLVIAYAILYLASAAVWRYPALRARKRLRELASAAVGMGLGTGAGLGAGFGDDAGSDGESGAGLTRAELREYAQARVRYENRSASLYGWVYRHHPGIAPLRWLMMVILVAIAVMLLFQWGFPWMAENIPFLQVASNYVSVG